jgi:hypothetical protein
MSPAEAGRLAVADWPPPTDEQIDEAARIIAADIRDRMERAA